jgi:hypothetical protein
MTFLQVPVVTLNNGVKSRSGSDSSVDTLSLTLSAGSSHPFTNIDTFLLKQ